MTEIEEQVERVVHEYIQRKKGLFTMEDIHHRVFGEDVTFTTWKSVDEKYAEVDWDSNTFEEFLLTTKQVVDGGLDRISESYFDIMKPENLTVNRATSELDQNPYDETASSDQEPSGFEYEVDDGVIHVRYIHTDVTTDISPTGQVKDLVSEDSINFRIHPDKQLIVVESTYPPDVQTMKGVFRKQTEFATTVCGNLTTDFEEANSKVKQFQDSFETADLEEDLDVE